MISEVGVGEGLAAVRGHQSGAEGAAVAMPTLSPGDRSGSQPLLFRFLAPTPFSRCCDKIIGDYLEL